MKCINKKNLAKSQSLLGKEIKILKVSLGAFVCVRTGLLIILLKCLYIYIYNLINMVKNVENRLAKTCKLFSLFERASTWASDV